MSNLKEKKTKTLHLASQDPSKQNDSTFFEIPKARKGNALHNGISTLGIRKDFFITEPCR